MNLWPQRGGDGTIAFLSSAPSAQSCLYHKCYSRMSSPLRAQRDQPQGKHNSSYGRSCKVGQGKQRKTEVLFLIGTTGTNIKIQIPVWDRTNMPNQCWGPMTLNIDWIQLTHLESWPRAVAAHKHLFHRFPFHLQLSSCLNVFTWSYLFLFPRSKCSSYAFLCSLCSTGWAVLLLRGWILGSCWQRLVLIFAKGHTFLSLTALRYQLFTS